MKILFFFCISSCFSCISRYLFENRFRFSSSFNITIIPIPLHEGAVTWGSYHKKRTKYAINIVLAVRTQKYVHWLSVDLGCFRIWQLSNVTGYEYGGCAEYCSRIYDITSFFLNSYQTYNFYPFCCYLTHDHLWHK